jgi:hypothetical protein
VRVFILTIYFYLLIHVKIRRRGVVGEAHRTKVAQHISLKKNFNLNPKAYTQGPCCLCICSITIKLFIKI